MKLNVRSTFFLFLLFCSRANTGTLAFMAERRALWGPLRVERSPPRLRSLHARLAPLPSESRFDFMTRDNYAVKVVLRAF